ncbi:hypothetical protein Tco_0840172 [Tanacetum coccineum]|uniref:MAK10-like protein n=1 Tax=Tanacetum coccineum TaxID=301880 RepID=A0ABQ5ASR9_9ASTR
MHVHLNFVAPPFSMVYLSNTPDYCKNGGVTLALYDNESWNDPKDFAKPVKEIALPQDVPSTSNRRLIELENQVQCLMEAHLAPKQPTKVNKITTSCEICNGPYDTLYCMKDPEQAIVEYASSRSDKAGGGGDDGGGEGGEVVMVRGDVDEGDGSVVWRMVVVRMMMVVV